MKGLVLSGGGSHAFAHLGVLKAFEEEGVQFDAVSGCSSGAIVGAFYATGKPILEIYDLLSSIKILKLLRLNKSRDGLFNLDVIQNELKLALETDYFSDLKKKLIVNATDLTEGTTKYFSEDYSLTDAILASCSLPLIFVPKQIRQSYYIDGGYLNNLPSQALEKTCDYILGVNVYSFSKTDIKKWTYKSILRRALPILCKSNIIESSKKCNHVIVCDELEKFNPLSTKHSKVMFKIGYEKGKKFLCDNDVDILY